MTNLTTTEINQLSGWELDAAVAEHVMGWGWVKTNPDLPEYEQFTHPTHGASASRFTDNRREINYYMVAWNHYSTDIAAAFEVVAKMQERDLKLRLLVGPRYTYAAFGISGTSTFYEDATSTLPPTAITRAALLAVAEKGARDE